MNNFTEEQIYEYGMRDIAGYEGLYAVTSCGRVWSYRRKIFLKPIKDKDGYLTVNLSKDGNLKNKKIHRLVAITYLENPNNYKEISHLDETRTNNCINNLSWVSHSENCNMPLFKERIAAAKSKTVRCLDDKILYPSTNEASRQTGIDQSSISKACRGVLKTTGGKRWMYEEDYQNMLVAELLEIAFLNDDEEEETDGSEMVSICGIPLNDYLAMNEAI